MFMFVTGNLRMFCDIRDSVSGVAEILDCFFSEVEGTTVLRNIVNCLSLDTTNMPEDLNLQSYFCLVPA